MVRPWTWQEAEDRRSIDAEGFRRNAYSTIFNRLAKLTAEARDTTFGRDIESSAFLGATEEAIGRLARGAGPGVQAAREQRRRYTGGEEDRGAFGRAVRRETGAEEGISPTGQRLRRMGRREEEPEGLPAYRATTWQEAEDAGRRITDPRGMRFEEAEDILASGARRPWERAVHDPEYLRRRREELAKKYERGQLTPRENQEMIDIESEIGGGRGVGAFRSAETKPIPTSRKEAAEMFREFTTSVIPPEASQELGRVPGIGRGLQRSAENLSPATLALGAKFPVAMALGEVAAIGAGQAARRVNPKLELPAEIIGGIAAPTRLPGTANRVSRIASEEGIVLRGGFNLKPEKTYDRLINEAKRTLSRRLPADQRKIQQRRLYELETEREIAIAVRDNDPETAFEFLNRDLQDTVEALESRGLPQYNNRATAPNVQRERGIKGESLAARIDTLERFLGNARFEPLEETAARVRASSRRKLPTNEEIGFTGGERRVEPAPETAPQVERPPAAARTRAPSLTERRNALSRELTAMLEWGEPHPFPNMIRYNSLPIKQQVERFEAEIARRRSMSAPKTAPQASPLKRGMPEQNYVTRLSDYTDTLYHETSMEDLKYLSGMSRRSVTPDIYMSNTPDLALGQGSNRGVLLEFDANALQGQVNRSKPTWQFSWEQGQAEFIGKRNDYSNAIKSITIKPDAPGSRSTNSAVKQGLLPRLEREGWQKVANADGSVTYRRPDVTAPRAEEPLVERARFTETGEVVREPTFATEGELGGIRSAQGRLDIGAGERPIETAGPMFERRNAFPVEPVEVGGISVRFSPQGEDLVEVSFDRITGSASLDSLRQVRDYIAQVAAQNPGARLIAVPKDARLQRIYERLGMTPTGEDWAEGMPIFNVNPGRLRGAQAEDLLFSDIKVPDVQPPQRTILEPEPIMTRPREAAEINSELAQAYQRLDNAIKYEPETFLTGEIDDLVDEMGTVRRATPDQPTLEGTRPPTGPPGRRPPGGGVEEPLPGMPPERAPYKAPTLADLKKQTNLTPEQRAARIPQPRQALYAPGEFQATTDRTLGGLARNIFTKTQEVLQLVPGGRWFGQYMEPEAAAKIRAAQGEPIPMAMLRRDAYVTTEKLAATVSVQAWKARNRKLLGLTVDGRAKKIQLKPGVTGVPKKMIGRIDDIALHADDYVMTTQQRAALQPLIDTQTAMLKAQLAAGIDIKEIQDIYYARIVTKSPKGATGAAGVGGRGLRIRMGHAKPRSFDDMRDGAALGWEYANALEALEIRLHSGIDSIANQRVVGEIKGLGVRPSERIPKHVQDTMNAAAERYKQVRKAGNPIDTEVAAEEYLRARQAWRHEADRAMQPRMGEAIGYGRIVPAEVMDEVAKYFDLRGGGGTGELVMDEVFRVIRATKVTADLSALGVQGATLFYRNNPMWWKAAAYSVVALAKTPEQYFARNIDQIRDGINYRAISPPTELLLSEGGGVSQFIGKLPVVKQTQRAFEWFTFIGQTEMWKATGWKATDDAAKRELASVVRKELGVVSRIGLTRTQRGVDRGLFFAPAFMRAVVGLPLDAMRGGPRGTEARKAVASVFAGYVALTTAAQLRQDGTMPNWTDFHDREKPWGKVVTEGGSFSLLGPLHSYVQAFGSAGQHLAEGNEKEAAQDMAYLARNRTSVPLGSFISFFVTGENPATGEPIEPGLAGSLDFARRQVGPIGVSEVLEGGPEGVQRFPLRIAEMGGINVNEFTPAIRRNRERDQATKRLFEQKYGPDVTFEQLTPPERDQVNADPSVAPWVEAAQERAAGQERPYELYRQERDGVSQRYYDQFSALEPELRETLQFGSSTERKAMRERIGQIQEQRARELEQLRNRYEGEGAFDFEGEDPYQSQMDIAMDEYVAMIYDDSLEDYATGEYNYSEREKRLADLEAKYGAQMVADVEEYLRRNEHPLVTELREDREKLAPYWDIADAVWAETQQAVPEARNYASLQEFREAEIQKMMREEGMNRSDAEFWLSKDPFLKQDQKYIDQDRKFLREDNPEIDRLLLKWGYVSKPVSFFDEPSGGRPERTPEPVATTTPSRTATPVATATPSRTTSPGQRQPPSQRIPGLR